MRESTRFLCGCNFVFCTVCAVANAVAYVAAHKTSNLVIGLADTGCAALMLYFLTADD